MSPSWSLVIHGGAGQLRREQVGAEGDAHARAAMAAALEAGTTILADGGSALEAIQALEAAEAPLQVRRFVEVRHARTPAVTSAARAARARRWPPRTADRPSPAR